MTMNYFYKFHSQAINLQRNFASQINPKKVMKTTREIYCQYLLSSQINYTCTNLAEHFEGLSHDSIYRYLKEDKITPKQLWEKVYPLIVQSSYAYIIFDDTVLEKLFGPCIDGVRRQYSGNAHGIINGIGVVNCVYYDLINEHYWAIDYRLFDPERDGKSKLDHVMDMLMMLKHRGLLFQTVLMDSWYATTDIMKYLIKEEKLFYCPLKKNRKVDDSKATQPYQSIEELQWSDEEMKHGKGVKVQKFPGSTYLKLFRVAIANGSTEYIVTNDSTQSSTQDAEKESALRWKVEQLHREEKQTTGISQCQCRLNRSQRNHIGAAILVWVCLAHFAYQKEVTVYQLKHKLLNDYLSKQLSNPNLIYT